MNLETLARIAYCNYGRTTDFKNYQGNPMPKWEDLPDKIKNAWRNATKSVWDAVMIVSNEKNLDGLTDLDFCIE